MHRSSATPRKPLALLAFGILFNAACGGADPSPSSSVTAYVGARVITGDGGPPIEDAVFVVEEGRLTAVGPSSDVEPPPGATLVNLEGRTVIPALVNAHFHLSSDREERVDQLQHSAYYGAGAVLSLGLDDGELGLEMRSETIPDAARSQSAGRGITSPEPGRSEVPFWVTTEDEARASVRELASQGVDIVKIWVDSRGDRYERLSQPLYSAVIDEAHNHGLRVAAHVFTLEDAKGLLRAGIDAFAHGIRDMDIDDELIELWLERPDVVLVPNLPGPGVVVDLDWLSGTVPADQLREMQDAQSDRPGAQEAFGIQARNLVRLNDAGIKIAFGTDGGSPWAVHQEMEDMVRAGMTPAEVLVAATSTSAEFMQMPDVGSVAAGKSADFVVLRENPLDDITNTRLIDAVYLRGDRVDRVGMGARFRGSESP